MCKKNYPINHRVTYLFLFQINSVISQIYVNFYNLLPQQAFFVKNSRYKFQSTHRIV